VKTKQQRSVLISNTTERKRVTLALFIAFAFIIGSFIVIQGWMLKQIPLHTRSYISFYENFGAIARIGFFFSVAIYPVYLLLKYKRLPLKSFFIFLAKIARQWHVPVGVISIGVVIVHASLALLDGFHWDAAYISGVLSLCVLGILAFTGLMRYKKLDKKWHLILGILFVTLFMIHTMFFERT
jgi:hypothetical protein